MTGDETGLVIAAELIEHIEEHMDASPRSQQVAIGPSEIGNPCPRWHVLKILGARRVNPRARSGWAAFLGTCGHAGLAEAMEAARRPGRTWLAERKVTAAPGLSGTCDLFEVETGTVIDWKIVSAKKLRLAKDEGLDAFERYRIQAHTYGVGWAKAGHTVERVMVMFLPRESGDLRGMHHAACERFDPQIAHEALQFHHLCIAAAFDLDLDEHPERIREIPVLPSPDCRWCPFYRRGTTDPLACPGGEAARAERIC